MWTLICVYYLLKIASWLAMPLVGDPFYPGEWADTDDVYNEPDNAFADWIIFILGTVAIRLAIAAIKFLYNAATSPKLPVEKALRRRLPKVTTIIIKDPAACIAAVYALPESCPASPLAVHIPNEVWNNVSTRPLAGSRWRSTSAPAASAPSFPSPPVSPTNSPTASTHSERNDVLPEPFWQQLDGLPTAASAASTAASPPPPAPGPITGGPPPPGAFSNAVMAEFYLKYPKTGTKRVNG